MSGSGSTFRAAAPDDAAALAALVNFAGEGLPLYLWGHMAEPGEDPWEIGRRRALRDAGSFSYRNATVADVGGTVAATLIGYRLPDVPEPVDWSEMPAMFVPLQQLEDLAPATWYVNVLATMPEFRGRGLGTRLLRLADEFAADTAARGLSLVVADANAAARRLYGRCGYREVAARPMVKEDWAGSGRDWLLLVKDRG
ncbi:GNAT family N-acetyltransferase [Faunimonas sp. B44]|uniref:GNAT family N-acetyltransferase n=1 Tax=Faunimonas sp. B44 TaxID=3461493 RepID=UPI004043F576